jgi:dynein heavy chain
VTLLDDFFNEGVLSNKNYKFGPEDSFKVPKLSTLQEYLDHIQTLPHLIHPNVFGFHSNADITKDINETNLLLESVLLCSSESSGGGGQTLEEIL